MAAFHGKGAVVLSLEARKGRKWITGNFAGHTEALAREMAQKKFGWSPIVRRLDTKEIVFRYGKPVISQEKPMPRSAARHDTSASPQPSAPPRFTGLDAKGGEVSLDSKDAVAILDGTTGLVWDRAGSGKRLTYKQAEKYANGLKLLGKKDWRLPTVDELFALADRTRHGPAIDTAAFPDCKSEWYWTSTPCAWAPAVAAWVVFFSHGSAYDGSGRGYGYRVRAVRSGQ